MGPYGKLYAKKDKFESLTVTRGGDMLCPRTYFGGAMSRKENREFYLLSAIRGFFSLMTFVGFYFLTHDTIPYGVLWIATGMGGVCVPRWWGIPISIFFTLTGALSIVMGSKDMNADISFILGMMVFGVCLDHIWSQKTRALLARARRS